MKTHKTAFTVTSIYCVPFRPGEPGPTARSNSQKSTAMMRELAMDTFPRAGDFGPQHVWRLRSSWSLELSPIAWRSGPGMCSKVNSSQLVKSGILGALFCSNDCCSVLIRNMAWRGINRGDLRKNAAPRPNAVQIREIKAALCRTCVDGAP